MSEENKSVMRRLIEEGYNGNNLDVLGELVAPDVFNHTAVPEHQRGIEGFKHVTRWGHTIFPDALQDRGHDGRKDKGACRITFSGIHEGELWNISPTVKRFSVEHVHWYRLAGGKLM